MVGLETRRRERRTDPDEQVASMGRLGNGEMVYVAHSKTQNRKYPYNGTRKIYRHPIGNSPEILHLNPRALIFSNNVNQLNLYKHYAKLTYLFNHYLVSIHKLLFCPISKCENIRRSQVYPKVA